MVVPKAVSPVARGFASVPAVDALQAVGVVAADDSSLTTIEVGLPGVSVLLARSFLAESETRPSGVT